MTLTNPAAATALAALSERFEDVEQIAPWRWQCATREEEPLSVSAYFSDGFLRLSTEARPDSGMRRAMEQALRLNACFGAGVNAAIDPRAERLKLYTDIVVLNEPQVRARLAAAAQNFRPALDVFASGDGSATVNLAAVKDYHPSECSEVLRQSSWECVECGDGEWSVALDAEAAPPARVRIREDGMVARVELVRENSTAAACRQALALFLLMAGWTLRLVRICAFDFETQRVFAFEAGLSRASAPEELDHALASLSVAHNACVREANLLLDETAACSYLGIRAPSFTSEPINEKEIRYGQGSDSGRD